MALVIHDGEHHEPEFIDQQMITNPEPCNFLDSDIERLKLKGSFPPGTVFRPYDANAQADFRSNKWVCFPEYPFTIGIKYPFPSLFNDFFSTTELCYSQTMPMVWRVLSAIQTLTDLYDLSLGIPEITQTYNLRSHGNHYFLFQTKHKHSPLVLRATPNDPKWKGRFFFVAHDSLPDGDLISSIWVEKAPLFTDLAPPTLDTEANLKKFQEIPESNRTFKSPYQVESVGSQESEATMSAHFSLDDIDTETPVKSVSEASKPRIPNLRSKSAKKRKAEEVIDLCDLGVEASRAVDLLVRSYNEREETITGLRKIGLAMEADRNRDAAELSKIKKELKETKSLLNKSVSEADNRVAEAKRILVEETKKDAAIAIFEGRIKMVNEANAHGVDTSFWDVETWKTRLAKLKGPTPIVESNPEDPSAKAPKATKSKSNKTNKPVSEKTSPPTGEDMVVDEDAMNELSSVKEVLEGLAAAGDMVEGGSTLGEDGK